MSVTELSREQLQCLKQRHCMMDGINLSWGELCAIDELVSDAYMFECYEGVIFTEDDFWF